MLRTFAIISTLMFLGSGVCFAANSDTQGNSQQNQRSKDTKKNEAPKEETITTHISGPGVGETKIETKKSEVKSAQQQSKK